MTDLCLIVSDPSSQSSWSPILVHQSILLPVCSQLESLITAGSLVGSTPTIILADTTLSTLQCLLTLVYTGKCGLRCDDSDLQMLMKSVGFCESIEIETSEEDLDPEVRNTSSDIPEQGAGSAGHDQNDKQILPHVGEDDKSWYPLSADDEDNSGNVALRKWNKVGENAIKNCDVKSLIENFHVKTNATRHPAPG